MIFIGRLLRGLEAEAAALRVSLSSLFRVCLSTLLLLLLRSRSPSSTLPPTFYSFPPSQRTFTDLRATIVSQTTVLTTFMREISSLARQITPPRLSLNPSTVSLPPLLSSDTLSTLISLRPWYQAILACTKAKVFNRAGHFYEPRIMERLISLHGYEKAVHGKKRFCRSI